MNHAEAVRVADRLIARFESACERIEIKGSLARLRSEVKDIDILLVPDLTPLPRPHLEFGKPLPVVHKTMLDKMIAEMEEEGSIIVEKNGPKGKRFYLKNGDISVELYLVLPPATWGVRSLVVTGPKDFSHWVVTRRKMGGALPNGYRVQDGAVWEGDRHAMNLEGETIVGFDEEKDFLNFLGLGWIEPKDRVAKWARR